jgi:hypothetical protein
MEKHGKGSLVSWLSSVSDASHKRQIHTAERIVEMKETVAGCCRYGTDPVENSFTTRFQLDTFQAILHVVVNPMATATIPNLSM